MDQQVTYQYNSEYQSPPPPPPPRRPNYLSSPGVIGILVICIAIFGWMMIDINSTAFMTMWPDQPMPWMFVTSIFMHGSFYHIFFNMFMLYMFGMVLEKVMGTTKFLALFFIAGVVGNIGYVIFCTLTGSDTPAIGASGALYGVFACLAIMMPNMRVYFFFAIPMKIIHALIIFAAFDILFISSNDQIAHAAHLAGLVAGFMFGMYLKNKLQKPQPGYHNQNSPYR